MVREPGKGSQTEISFEAFKLPLLIADLTVVSCDDPRYTVANITFFNGDYTPWNIEK